MKCGSSCSYEKNNIIYTVSDAYSDSRLKCIPSFYIENVTVKPPLPEGMEMQKSGPDIGKIYGTPMISYSQAEYEVVVRGREFFEKVMIKFVMVKRLSRCEYSSKELLFVRNYPNYIMSPKCDSVTTSFIGSGYPNWIEANSSTGAMIGTAKNADVGSGKCWFIIKGIEVGKKIIMDVPYTVINESDAGVGILGEFIYGQSEWSDDYKSIIEQFQNNTVRRYMNVFEETTYLCDGNEDCLAVGGNFDNMYGKWTASLKFEEVGKYTFKYSCLKYCSIFIDDLLYRKGEVSSRGREEIYEMSVSSIGYHAFQILHYNDHTGVGESGIRIQWKTPSSDEFVTIPKSNLRYGKVADIVRYRKDEISNGGITESWFSSFSYYINTGSKINKIRIYDNNEFITHISVIYENDIEVPTISTSDMFIEYSLIKDRIMYVYVENNSSQSIGFRYMWFNTSNGNVLYSRLKSDGGESHKISIGGELVGLCGEYSKNNTLKSIGFYSIG